MRRWLRITMYVVVSVVGVGGAVFGYSKSRTMMAVLVVALGIEGANYLVRGRPAQNP